MCVGNALLGHYQSLVPLEHCLNPSYHSAFCSVALYPRTGGFMLDRRHFLTTAAAGVAASLAFRGDLLAQIEKAPPLPDRSLLDTNEDAFWAEMRRQFLIPEDEIYLNNGTVGSSPVPVLRAIFDGYTASE